MCRKFSVSGRVQGVFFRASTADRARALKINGYAINLPDGTVEVIACGAEEDIGSLREWLTKGPPGSVVQDVAERPVQCSTPRGFTTA